MDQVLTIACVYRPGNGFCDDYVYRLKDAFAQHCAAPHRFVCLTNRKLPDVETQPLEHAWPTWWPKLELFNKGRFNGPVVYSDLDAMLVSDVTDICTHSHDFSIIKGWCGFKEKRAGADESRFNSAFMAWDGTQDLSHIPGAFNESRIAGYLNWTRWGDQGFIQDHLARPAQKMQDLFPDRIVLYKMHLRGPDKTPLPLPPRASIVCFSGKPRPHEIKWTLPAS